MISAGNTSSSSLKVMNSNKKRECPLTLKSPVGMSLNNVEAVKLKIDHEGEPTVEAYQPTFSH